MVGSLRKSRDLQNELIVTAWLEYLLVIRLNVHFVVFVVLSKSEILHVSKFSFSVVVN